MFTNTMPQSEYLTGDAFQALADFTYERGMPIPVHKEGGRALIAFTTTRDSPALLDAIRLVPSCRYVVLSHNCDCNIVNKVIRTKCPLYSYPLADVVLDIPDNVVRMFSQNVDVYNDRITPIPIGFENRLYFPKARKQDKLYDYSSLCFGIKQRQYLCSMEFNCFTNLEERVPLYPEYSGCRWMHQGCGCNDPKHYDEYISTLSRSRFVLCPDGNGIDCVRVWESLTLGCIPIVRNRACYKLFSVSVPMYVRNDLLGITESELIEASKRLEQQSYNYNCMKISYWKEKTKEAAECQ